MRKRSLNTHFIAFFKNFFGKGFEAILLVAETLGGIRNLTQLRQDQMF